MRFRKEVGFILFMNSGTVKTLMILESDKYILHKGPVAECYGLDLECPTQKSQCSESGEVIRTLGCHTCLWINSLIDS